jgi:hypothetical protein
MANGQSGAGQILAGGMTAECEPKRERAMAPFPRSVLLLIEKLKEQAARRDGAAGPEAPVTAVDLSGSTSPGSGDLAGVPGAPAPEAPQSAEARTGSTPPEGGDLPGAPEPLAPQVPPPASVPEPSPAPAQPRGRLRRPARRRAPQVKGRRGAAAAPRRRAGGARSKRSAPAR